MYDYDHTCVTGVRCFIDVSRNTEIKKMERERERKMSSKGFSAGAVCWGMLLCPNTRSIPTELTLFLSLFSIVQD